MATAANAIHRTHPRRDRRHHPIRLLVATSILLLACLVSSASAFAAPPNDAFANATTISGLPFTDSVDMAGATLDDGEPQFCSGAAQSVWYAYTPTHDGKLGVTTAGSQAAAQVTAYRADGPGLGGLSYVGCETFGYSKAVFDVQAGTTYYLQAGTVFGGGGVLALRLEEELPPANDDFAHATPVASVPYSASLDLTAAGAEPGEPAGCSGFSPAATAWYAFTPARTGSYVVTQSGYGSVTAFTGGSLATLSQVACGSYQTYFHADAGTTTYLQVAGSGGGGASSISIDDAPPATASFFYSPSDPSSFDTVSFYDYSFDFAGIGSRRWQLGDGFTSTDAGFGHRFAADGSYSAKLDITTNDGRTASSTQTVAVKTHDVAITAMTVPDKGRAGRTKQIAVGVNDSRYPETVRVSILRSVPGAGFEEVGQVTQGVPARAARRKTDFAISYTFSDEDAAYGKVTFEAVATILTARDANPSDNTVIAPATTVKP